MRTTSEKTVNAMEILRKIERDVVACLERGGEPTFSMEAGTRQVEEDGYLVSVDTGERTVTLHYYVEPKP